MSLAPLLLASASADAQSLAPLTYPVGEAELRLAGEAEGAAFEPHQPGWRGVQESGDARLMPELVRNYDSGLSLALLGTFALSDPLSRGRYDGKAIERLAGSLHSGLGQLEIGLTDGAGYDLAVTGPKVDPGISLEDPRTSFFRDPTTHRPVIDMVALRTEVGASSNYAKFSYTSPALFGVELGLSFTPSQGRQLPFLNAGPHLPGRQADIWEAALRYQMDLGPVSVTAGGALAEGRAEHKLPGQEGVSDLSAGMTADYPLTENIGLSVGGSYRQSNAHGFAIDQSWQSGTTRIGYGSARLTDGPWSAGLEYGTGAADAVDGLPRLGLNGLEALLGYRVSGSARFSTGWQHLVYSRGNGRFFNGLPQLKLDAVFLHLNLQTSEQ